MMKKIYFLFFLTLSIQQLLGQEVKYIKTENLNIRSGPGKNYPVVDTAPLGNSVTVISQSGNWTEIETQDGVKGYASSKFLSSSEPGANDSKEESTSIWKILMYIFGFYVLYKIFSGKRSSSHSSNSPSRPRSLTIAKKSSSHNSSTFVTSVIPTIKSNPVSEKSTSPKSKRYFCKYCGAHYPSLSTLTINQCKNSPTGKHGLFEGEEMKRYFCKCCGIVYPSIGTLTTNQCKNSRSGKHQPYEGQEKKSYNCKFCGSRFSSIGTMTANQCIHSPHGRHQPLV